jgi:hypothetical protein
VWARGTPTMTTAQMDMPMKDSFQKFARRWPLTAASASPRPLGCSPRPPINLNRTRHLVQGPILGNTDRQTQLNMTAWSTTAPHTSEEVW